MFNSKEQILLSPPVRLFSLLFIFLFIYQGTLFSQHASVGLSTTHDPNIFQNYSPLADQVYGSELSIDKDFDFDNLSVSLAYYGSLQLYRDLTTKNYSVHQLSLSSSYLLGSDPDDDSSTDSDSTEAIDDSTESEGDSVALIAPKPVPPKQYTAPSDSVRHILYGNFFGSKQFDKQDYSIYDNSAVGSEIIYRFPFGEKVSLRSSVSLLYHNYPNLQAITSADNVLSFIIGTTHLPLKWFGGGIHLGTKHYPTSTIIYDTIVVGKKGHGKLGGGNGIRVHQYDFTQPSVSQISWTINFDDSVTATSVIRGQYMRYGHSNREARLLANTVTDNTDGLADEGTFSTLNDIYDDHYAYDGDRIEFHVEQALPYAIMLTAAVEYNHKTYTGAAYDHLDSLVAPNRIDNRHEEVVGISKSMTLSPTVKLKPNLEITFLKNSSNAEYYDFSFSKIVFGIELIF
jgi:hypothetical protein